jgi:hypothetical protein
MRRCDQPILLANMRAIVKRGCEVFPVPEVGWSDWGSVERILTSLKQMGKLEETVARAATIAKERDVTPTWC